MRVVILLLCPCIHDSPVGDLPILHYNVGDDPHGKANGSFLRVLFRLTIHGYRIKIMRGRAAKPEHAHLLEAEHRFIEWIKNAHQDRSRVKEDEKREHCQDQPGGFFR